jgi:putative transposase
MHIKSRKSSTNWRTIINEEYTRHPFYGSRKMVVFLKTEGHIVNRKRASDAGYGFGGYGTGTEHRRTLCIYPYLLRGVAVVKPNQVRSTDII